MRDRFTVHNVDNGVQLRPNKFSNPAAALAYGYAWVEQQSSRCPDHGLRGRARQPRTYPWCGCADFVVRDEAGDPVAGARCVALALGFAQVRAS